MKLSKNIPIPFFVLLFLIIFSALTINNYLHPLNIYNITRQASVLALVAIGQCIVILLGGIDLSQGSVMGFTAVCTALILQTEIPFILGLILGLLIAFICGFINGALIAFLDVDAFVSTFGMYGMALGLGLVISKERVIWGFNESIRFLQDGHLFGIPMPFVIVAGSYLLFYYLLRYTKFGTSIYAVGGNKNAAVLAGIPIKINIAVTYGLSGLMAGAAGIMMVARMNSSQAIIGTGYQFEAIAAVILGGTNRLGGEGGIIRTLIGVFIIAALRNSLNLIGVSVYMQLVAIGSVLIVAYLIEYLKKKNVFSFIKIGAAE